MLVFLITKKENKIILLQEADELIYRCAFGCQVKDNLITEKYIVNSRVDTMITNLWWLEHPVLGPTKDVNLWLSPSDHSNFRYSIANTPGPKGPGYKAGRGEKPIWYLHIRERLITEWGAKEIHGFEADDALGIYQTEATCASHIDKDINMIYGHHYNHVTGEFTKYEKGLGILELLVKTNENTGKTTKKLIGGGIKWFYAQMLMGDPTDNIPGIRKVGDVAAYEILDPCGSEEQCFAEIHNCYRAQYGEEYLEVLKECADLLFICTSKDETGRQYLQKRGFI